MLGTTYFERRFARRSKMIFDFDDAIWLHVVSAGNKALGFLKNPDKTAKLIQLADLNFAGNSFLANYALQYNPATVLVPTVVDTDNYKRKPQPERTAICIGWSGSFSTIPYFELVQPALVEIKKKYGERVYFKVIGDPTYRNAALGIEGVPWSEQTEIKELSELDIGIMPLPNDDWAKGKCALKGLLYMSLGIPAVLSDVGVNSEVIEDGHTGFLFRNEREWVEKLSLLI